MARITKVKLIQLREPNRVGLGADVLDIIANSKSNVVAINAWEEDKSGVFLIDTSNNTKAKVALRKAKYAVDEAPALKVLIDNKPGKFAELVRRIADAKINIGEAFSVATGKTATVYIKTAADTRAAKAMSVKPAKTPADKKTSARKTAARK